MVNNTELPVVSPPYKVLTRRLDFVNLIKNGKRIFPSSWMIINFDLNQSSEFRIGWTVPRGVGSAVIRNRLKRWCREILRQTKLKKESGFDINIVFKRRGKDFYKQLKYEEFKRVLLRGLSKI